MNEKFPGSEKKMEYSRKNDCNIECNISDQNKNEYIFGIVNESKYLHSTYVTAADGDHMRRTFFVSFYRFLLIAKTRKCLNSGFIYLSN